MNDRVGQVAFPKEEGQWPQDRLYSNATAEVMDQEVRQLVDEAYKRTLALMETHREQVRLVAELLLEKETITHNDVTRLIGNRPYSAGKEYDEFVNSSDDFDAKEKEKETAAADKVTDEKPADDTVGMPSVLPV